MTRFIFYPSGSVDHIIQGFNILLSLLCYKNIQMQMTINRQQQQTPEVQKHNTIHIAHARKIQEECYTFCRVGNWADHSQLLNHLIELEIFEWI